MDSAVDDSLRLPGRLTGNGVEPPVAGTYRFCRRGLEQDLPPDLASDVSQHGPISFATGRLTDGKGNPVGWRGSTLTELGADIVIELGGTYFIDRVVLVQVLHESQKEMPSSSLSMDAFGVAAPAVSGGSGGISHLAVYAAGGENGALRLLGRIGQDNADRALPARVEVSVGALASQLVLRFTSFRRDVLFSSLELWGAGLGQPRLFPLPQRMQVLPGEPFHLERCSGIELGEGNGDDLAFAARLLQGKLQRLGKALPLLPAGQVRGCVISLRLSPRESRPAGSGYRSLHDERYSLRLDSSGAALEAASRLGLVYAVEALLQLLAWSKPGVAGPCQIEDWPFLAMRGVHLYVPARRDIPFYKRLVSELLLPMRYNTVFIEVGGGMLYDRHPEIAEAWEQACQRAARGDVAEPPPHHELGGGSYLTKAEMRDLVDYTRAFGLEVIPEVQSLSHSQYILLAHPEIAERPTDLYPDSYCPLHPDTYPILFDVLDEVIEVFQPERYVHMGHDEVYTMCVCPRCQGQDKAELFAGDVNKIYEHLKQRGLGMIIWDDMINTTRPFACVGALDKIPRDVLILDFVWYDQPSADTEDILLEHGFEVAIGNYYSSHFPRYVSRARKPGVVGGEVSTWVGNNEADLGRFGKLYDFVYCGNSMWWTGYREEMRWTMDRAAARILARLRSRLGEEPLPSSLPDAVFSPIDLSALADVPRRDEGGTWDLEQAPKVRVDLAGIPFQLPRGMLSTEADGVRGCLLPSEVQIPLTGKAKSLVLLHAASSIGVIGLGAPGTPMGRYELIYADGSREKLELAWGWQLAEWDRRYGAPLPHMAHRHSGYVGSYPAFPLWQGKSASGKDVTLYGFEWLNPHPDRELRALRLAAPAEPTDCRVLLLGVTLVRSG